MTHVAGLHVMGWPGHVTHHEAVMSRMRQIRAEISEHDSVHRYTVDVGVDVFSGRAKFKASNEIALDGGETLLFRKCILGTGATAKVPRNA